MFDKDVPALLHPHHPDAKFIIMLRDPIARAYSHFYILFQYFVFFLFFFFFFFDIGIHMTTRTSSAEGPQKFDTLMKSHVERFNTCAEKEGFAECAAKGSQLFLNAGLYYYAVQRWFAFFPPERFIFVQFNDLVGENGEKVVKGTLQFNF
jgi:hypothetical protein